MPQYHFEGDNLSQCVSASPNYCMLLIITSLTGLAVFLLTKIKQKNMGSSKLSSKQNLALHTGDKSIKYNKKIILYIII